MNKKNGEFSNLLLRTSNVISGTFKHFVVLFLKQTPQICENYEGRTREKEGVTAPQAINWLKHYNPSARKATFAVLIYLNNIQQR